MADMTFIIAATGAIGLALVFVLVPLLAGASRRAPAILILGLVVLIPMATLALYRVVGTPEGLETDTPAQSLNQAIGQLARRLEREPDDAEGWLLLGLTYKQLEQFTSAEQALQRAVTLDENNAHAKVELAETLLFERGQSGLPPEAHLLLEQAVELDPKQQKALWLLGIAEFQNSDYQDALDWWQRLDALLEDGSVRASVREQMARARERLESAEPPPVTPPHDAAEGGAITVTVSLAPELHDGLAGDETVFIYARAVDGPPMPLAVQRLRVDDLPATVRLSDRDAMTGELRLSQFPEVTVTARVASTGDAVPQPGDLQGDSPPLPTTHSRPISIVINHRIE